MSASERVVSSEPLHVLTITPFYPRLGDESGGCFVAEPLAELVKLGVRCSVMAVRPFYRGEAKADTSAPAAHWYRYASLPGGLGLASAGKGLYFRLRRTVKALQSETPINLIHAHGALPCGQAARLLGHDLNIPYVVTVHGLDAFSSKQVRGRAGQRCIQVSREVYRDARRVIGVSTRVCQAVAAGAEQGCETVVVHNGVDPVLFAPGEDPVQPILLSVGNLIPTKGHEMVVEALAGLRTEFPKLCWEVIGEGPEMQRIQSLARALRVLEMIRFRGRQCRVEVASACRRCTLFVLPSRYEGLGCVYLEAMAAGKVALGCSGQGIEDIIRHGENGWLVAPDDRTQLVEGLALLLRDLKLRAEIGAAARKTILQSCTWEHQAQRLAAIYRECLA